MGGGKEGSGQQLTFIFKLGTISFLRRNIILSRFCHLSGGESLVQAGSTGSQSVYGYMSVSFFVDLLQSIRRIVIWPMLSTC